MKNKMATWSWISPIIGFLALNFFSLIDEVFPSLGLDKDSSIGLFILLASALIGLILGTIALKTISRNPEITGKNHAVAGRILSFLVLLFGLFGLLSGLSAWFLNENLFGNRSRGVYYPQCLSLTFEISLLGWLRISRDKHCLKFCL